MSAPVLSAKEQKKALSSKKKKKKVVKNVLGLPSNLKVDPCVLDDQDAGKLQEILERLLPAARLPIRLPKFKEKEQQEPTQEESELIKEAKNKRLQLSLGVNEINKNIKKDLISAVVLASDIEPKFLIHHLNLLCIHSNIPFVHISKLREITQSCLGFPCIAVGFKKNFTHFLEAISEIKSVSQSLAKKEKKEESSESEEEEINERTSESDKKVKFSYLYRTSNKKRVFVPEECTNETEKSEMDFIPIPQSDTKPKKVKKEKMLKKKDLNEGDDMDNEDLEVPKKKPRKDWVIDKVGTKQKFRYHSPNLFKVHSNPKRN